MSIQLYVNGASVAGETAHHLGSRGEGAGPDVADCDTVADIQPVLIGA